MVFNTTFTNISAMSRWSVILVKETRVPGENQSDLLQVTHKLYHITGFQLDFIILRSNDLTHINSSGLLY
jgi:hypothetical protein